MIPILLSIDDAFQNLYDTFIVPTYLKYQLDNNYKLYPSPLEKHSIGPYGFCTLSYSIYRQRHIQYLLSFLEAHPEHKYIISMDADMIFLRGFKHIVPTILNSNTEHKIWLASDSDIDKRLPNIGIMILENCNQTRDFLNWLLYYMGVTNKPCNYFYQHMSEHIATHPDYQIGLLDPNKFIHNNSPQFTIRNRTASINACSFHATSASNIYNKTLVLSQTMCFLEEQGL